MACGTYKNRCDVETNLHVICKSVYGISETANKITKIPKAVKKVFSYFSESMYVKSNKKHPCTILFYCIKLTFKERQGT